MKNMFIVFTVLFISFHLLSSGQSGTWPNAQMIPADFNGDGRTDFLVFRSGDGAFAKWYSGGNVSPSFNYQAVEICPWPDARIIPSDFNGDGKMDFLVFRPSDGSFAKWYSGGSIGAKFDYQAVEICPWPDAQIIPADFNGDRKMDILALRRSDGAFAKWYSNGSVSPKFNYQAVGYIGEAGTWPNAQMIPADFNGDGKMDFLVFRPSDGAFAKWYSDGSVGASFNYQAVGYIGGQSGAWPNAQMTPADFNGDGMTDILVFRSSDGAFAKWYSDGSVSAGFNYQGVETCPWPNAQMTPADFNGDGKVDLLVIRPSDGAFAKWYSDGSVGASFNYQAVGYIGGQSGAWPNAQMIPADFNGDRKMDVLVFHSANGAFAKWYSDGTMSASFNYQAVGYIGGDEDVDQDGIVDTFEDELLNSFRPFYRFSIDTVPDSYHPTDALWFIKNSSLNADSENVLSQSELSDDPGRLLLVNTSQFGSSDLYKYSGGTSYTLDIDDSQRQGELDWQRVQNESIGLYGHVAPLREDPSDQTNITAYKIEYWQFFAYNDAPTKEFRHEGDWETVQLVVEADGEHIRRVIHEVHGDQIVFDLANGDRADIGGGFIEYRGKGLLRPNYTSSLTVDVPGPAGYDLAQHNLLRFYCDEGGCTHPVVYIEHCGHAFWPTQHWRWTGARKHTGDGAAYLVAPPPNLGEVKHPNLKCAGADLILRYNGHWGDPPGPSLKSTWQNP